jgi:hypothetical protein
MPGQDPCYVEQTGNKKPAADPDNEQTGSDLPADEGIYLIYHQ